MARKVNVRGFRQGFLKNWDKNWYTDTKNYGKLLHNSINIERYVEGVFQNLFWNYLINRIRVSQKKTELVINVEVLDLWEDFKSLQKTEKSNITKVSTGLIHFTERKKEALSKYKEMIKTISEFTGYPEKSIKLHIKKTVSIFATGNLLAKYIGLTLTENESQSSRASFEKITKDIFNTIKDSSGGSRIIEMIRVRCSGTFTKGEMATSIWAEYVREGLLRRPLHTISAPIDYGFSIARTKTSVLGIKVWIYYKVNGENLLIPVKKLKNRRREDYLNYRDWILKNHVKSES